jgi:dihydrofolate reductase
MVFNMVSLDGYFEGPDGGIDWHSVDEEFNQFAAGQLDSVETLIFGRVTYQLMAQYWPTPTAIQDDPVIAGKMNAKSKIVVSTMLKQADWNNTRLIGKDVAGELGRLKDQPGRDLIVFGSGKLASSLTGLGLVDEFRLMINPVLLGGGRPLFAGLPERVGLQLLGTRTFGNGNVLVRYQPVGKE